jgi:hypothetical protein
MNIFLRISQQQKELRKLQDSDSNLFFAKLDEIALFLDSKQRIGLLVCLLFQPLLGALDCLLKRGLHDLLSALDCLLKRDLHGLLGALHNRLGALDHGFGALHRPLKRPLH